MLDDGPDYTRMQEPPDRQKYEQEREMQSEQIDQLATALSIAQGKITGALKDSANPFFKSKYADLASVWDACREALSANGLAVIQTTREDTEGVTVDTTLAHKSGQYIRGSLRMVPKDSTPQALGSCLTYARRYALAAIVGVAQVDDDANAASQRGDRSGRPDTSGVDPDMAFEYAKSMFDITQAASTERAKKLHDELNKDEALYTAVFDQFKSICKESGVTYPRDKWTSLVNPKKVA